MTRGIRPLGPIGYGSRIRGWEGDWKDTTQVVLQRRGLKCEKNEDIL